MGPSKVKKDYYVSSYQRRNQKFCYRPIIKNREESEPNENLLEILPEEILLRIFTYLSAEDGFRLASVSKQWQERKTKLCKQPVSIDSDVPAQQPWYLMFQVCESQEGDTIILGAYYSDMKSWHVCDLPWFNSCDDSRSNCFHAFHCCFFSSNGLVCVSKYDNKEIFICNPMLKCGRMLPKVPAEEFSGGDDRFSRQNGVVFSADVKDKTYKVAVVRFRERWKVDQAEVFIDLYESKKNCWRKLNCGKTSGVIIDKECVQIRNDVLYYVILLPIAINSSEQYHAVASYELSEPSSVSEYSSMVARPVIKMPAAFRSVRLINLRDRLVIIGEIEKLAVPVNGNYHRTFHVEAIGIWELDLDNNGWKEVARMPHAYMKGLNFSSGSTAGYGDFIYIYSSKSHLLIIFDFNHKRWKCLDAPICLRPRQRTFRHRLYGRCWDAINGFCFEPRLDICP